MHITRGSYLLGAALGSALMLGLSAGVAVADGYESDLKGFAPPPPPPSDRAFYVKGFIGQANPDVGGMHNEFYNSGIFTVRDHELKSSPLYGIGVGFKHSHWLRFDLTGEYRGDAIFVGSDSYDNGGGTPGDDFGVNDYTADIRSWLGLVNGYIDFCNCHGFTPYIGAGIGFATLTVDGLKDVNVAPLSGSVAYGANHTKSNFAWAIHAGVAFEVTPQVALDLSYRYADLGSTKTGPVVSYLGETLYSGHHIRDITSNDLLFGVRYKLQRETPVVYAVK